MLKAELKKRFEELGKALLCLNDGEVLGFQYNMDTKLIKVHVTDGEYPCHIPCEIKYVWRGNGKYPWEKQVVKNGVIYFDCITQEQFDREHAKENKNDE